MENLAIGIDLGGMSVRVALVNQDGKILQQLRAPTPVKEGPKKTAELMATLVNQIISKQNSPMGIGIGSPGPLSRSEKKIIKTPNLPGFDNFPLGQEVEKLTGLKVSFDNDAKAAAYGEFQFGAGKNKKNMILLTCGTGVGGGVFVDGKMLYGKSDNACEIGHMTLYPEGLQCPCGNRGCLEQYASATAAMRLAEVEFSRPMNGQELLELAIKKDDKALKVIDVLSHNMAIGVASLINIFDPEVVVLGGGLFSGGGSPLIEKIREKIKNRCFASAQQGLQIVPSSLGGDAGVLGAASLAFQAT